MRKPPFGGLNCRQRSGLGCRLAWCLSWCLGCCLGYNVSILKNRSSALCSSDARFQGKKLASRMVIDRHSCKSHSDARLLLGNLASLMGKEESTRSRSVKRQSWQRFLEKHWGQKLMCTSKKKAVFLDTVGNDLRPR